MSRMWTDTHTDISLCDLEGVMDQSEARQTVNVHRAPLFLATNQNTPLFPFLFLASFPERRAFLRKKVRWRRRRESVLRKTEETFIGAHRDFFTFRPKASMSSVCCVSQPENTTRDLICRSDTTFETWKSYESCDDESEVQFKVRYTNMLPW